MALLNLDPGSISSTIGTTAAGRIAQKIAQSASPQFVRDVQRVLNIGSQVGQALGLQTGIGIIDSLFGAIQRDAKTPLLGGLSLRQAQAVFERASNIALARKNLFFVRVTDAKPPQINASTNAGAQSSLFQSRIGPALTSIVSGAARSLAAASGGLVSVSSVSDMALSSFDLLCTDVSYTNALAGDHIQVGATFMDTPTGRSPTSMQITTMDDEAGTIKKWFEAKMRQVAHPDGTVGLPGEYVLTIEVVHAVPLDGGQQSMAYSVKKNLRADQMQLDLSRRDQGLEEVALTFSEVDPFL